MKLQTVAVCVGMLCVTPGCASDAADSGDAKSSSGAAPSDAAAAQDAAPETEAPDGGEDSGRPEECNSLEQAGEFVEARAEAGAAPKPEGGTTRDGVYVLESVVLYGATQAFEYRNKSTLQAAGLTVNVVEDLGRGDTRKTGSGVVSNTTLTLTETCAFPARSLRVERAEFTATADRILLFGAVGGRTLVQTFRKQ